MIQFSVIDMIADKTLLHPTRFQLPLEYIRKSVLEPCLFLFYINDIAVGLSSTVRLFTNDTMLYLTVYNNKDAELLQHDLDMLCQRRQLGYWSFIQISAKLSQLQKRKTRSFAPNIYMVTIYNMWIMSNTVP